MARFRIWNGSEWCDACQKEVYVRDTSGEWRRVVAGSEVWNGSEWIEIDCFNYYSGVYKDPVLGCSGGDIPGTLRTTSTLTIGKWYRTADGGAFYVSGEVEPPQPIYYEPEMPLVESNTCEGAILGGFG